MSFKPRTLHENRRLSGGRKLQSMPHLMDVPADFHALFNQIEAALWFTIALSLAIWLRMQRPWRWLLPLAFGVFGVSDLIEAQTGAWWDPWWLLVMKAACVLVFLLAFRQRRRQEKKHG
jgi:hypothetical protein